MEKMALKDPDFTEVHDQVELKALAQKSWDQLNTF
jgi:hypothetical protein